MSTGAPDVMPQARPGAGWGCGSCPFASGCSRRGRPLRCGCAARCRGSGVAASVVVVAAAAVVVVAAAVPAGWAPAAAAAPAG